VFEFKLGTGAYQRTLEAQREGGVTKKYRARQIPSPIHRWINQLTLLDVGRGHVALKTGCETVQGLLQDTPARRIDEENTEN
jgi:hypothetical protein